METELPLIVIVGPTASGKTALALDIAERWNGEIICADSRTVYKSMDIGTAKPTDEEQARVPHWGLDLVEPGERFTAADFKRYADEKIKDIRSRGKLPMLVGGTGLYIDSVMYDYSFGGKADSELRSKLEHMTIEALHEYCHKHNILLPENSFNKRYVIRAIERKNVSGIRKNFTADNIFVVGIATNMETLRTRIVQRIEHMFERGVVSEATLLGKKYGWDSEAMTGNIYPLLRLHLSGQLTEVEVKDRFTTLDYQLAKRQMTWFRRNPEVMWAKRTEASAYIHKLLAAE